MTASIIATGLFVTVIATVRSVAGVFQARFQSRPAALPGDVEQRLERIESAVDAIAIEVERIAEGQRYSLRLEEERAGRRLGGTPAAPPAPRVITPR